MMRSKAIATGLAIGVGLAANAAPALADTGGVSLENTGGLAVANTPKHANLAAKIRYVKEHMQSDTAFQAFTLDPNTFNADKQADIEVTQIDGSNTGMEIVNPIAILSADGGSVAAYVGRQGELPYVIPANHAEITGYIGNVAFPVNPEDALTPHTLRLTPDTGRGVVGFTATDSTEGFGLMP